MSAIIRQHLNDEHIKALHEVAKSHGRKWKQALRLAWYNGNYQNLCVDVSHHAYLENLRNIEKFGPSGLIKYTLPRGVLLVKGQRFIIKTAWDGSLKSGVKGIILSYVGRMTGTSRFHKFRVMGGAEEKLIGKMVSINQYSIDNHLQRGDEHLWLRIGDAAEYEQFGEDISAMGDALFEHDVKLPYYFMLGGFTADGYTSANYVSCYWGDSEGNLTRQLAKDDQKELELKVKMAFEDHAMRLAKR